MSILIIILLILILIFFLYALNISKLSNKAKIAKPDIEFTSGLTMTMALIRDRILISLSCYRCYITISQKFDNNIICYYYTKFDGKTRTEFTFKCSREFINECIALTRELQYYISSQNINPDSPQLECEILPTISLEAYIEDVACNISDTRTPYQFHEAMPNVSAKIVELFNTIDKLSIDDYNSFNSINR